MVLSKDPRRGRRLSRSEPNPASERSRRGGGSKEICYYCPMTSARSSAALLVTSVVIGLGAIGLACGESDEGTAPTLNSDSTLTGRVELPANTRITGELDAVNQDLTGTWALHRDEVRLHLDEPVLGNQPVFRVGTEGNSLPSLMPVLSIAQCGSASAAPFL